MLSLCSEGQLPVPFVHKRCCLCAVAEYCTALWLRWVGAVLQDPQLLLERSGGRPPLTMQSVTKLVDAGGWV